MGNGGMILDHLDQFVIVRAKFKPRRTDDLVEGVEPFIDRWMNWQAMWQIEEGENDYAGEWAMRPLTDQGKTFLGFPAAWVPSGDLGD